MKRLFLSVLASLALAPFAGFGADAGFTNSIFSSISIPPTHIDANTIFNRGTITASGTLPFEPFDLFTLINSGTMSGSPGWVFDHVSTIGYESRMMSTFINTNSGLITALTAPVIATPCEISAAGPSRIVIWATNIFNTSGGSAAGGPSLIVGSAGIIQMVGTNIDLSRSGVQVTAVSSETVDGVGVYDRTAGQTNYSATSRLNTSGLWNGASATTGGGANPAFTLTSPVSDSYINVDPASLTTMSLTNYTGSATNVTGTNIFTISFNTNIIKGAGYAQGIPGATVQVGFTPGTTPPFASLNTIGALVTVMVSNSVTGLLEPAYFGLADTLASSATRGLTAATIGCPPVGSIPACYTLTRLTGTPNIPGGPGNNGVPDANFFTKAGLFLSLGTSGTNIANDAVTNATVTAGENAAYSAFLDSVASRPPAIPAGTISNIPGRIEITGNSVDLRGTHLQAPYIHINAPTVLTDTNTVVNSENYSLELGSATSGMLNVQHLIPANVARLQGTVSAWSALWTNQVNILITNNYVFTNVDVTPAGSTNGVTNVVALQSPLTNSITVVYHTMMFDGRAFVTSLPVYVNDLVTHGTNVVLTDPMSVVQLLTVPGQSLTLQGNLTILGAFPSVPIGTAPTGTPLQSFTTANAPNLLYFTNYGAFSIPDQAHFGDDGPHPYAAFVNTDTGRVSAASIQINSDYFENDGVLTSGNGLYMHGGTGKLESGQSTSGNVTEIQVGSLKLNNYLLTSGNAVFLTVTNSLLDAGPGSGNVLTAPYGFNLLIKPRTGDLLGTTLSSTAPRLFSAATHTWAGEDRGPSPAGYSNNEAVGTYLLKAGDAFARHYFVGSGATNALYVDVLDLSALIAFQTQIQIDPSLVVYFAAAKLNSTPPVNASGVPQQPEEYLDGQFGGHLKWVSSYAGPNSGVDVLINGKTVRINKALRFSKIIDSNGNGLPNFYDSNPFDGLVLTAAQTNLPPSKAISISWNAAPNTVYQIEFTPSLSSMNWQPLFKYTNTASAYGPVTVGIANAPGAGFIRASYGP